MKAINKLASKMSGDKRTQQTADRQDQEAAHVQPVRIHGDDQAVQASSSQSNSDSSAALNRKREQTPNQVSSGATTTSVTTSGATSAAAQSRGPALGTYDTRTGPTSAVATGSSEHATWHQKTSLVQSSVGGLHVAPIQAAINTTDLYKDYLPNRNNVWLQSIIAQMNAMSLEIDQYAKAQQEVISTEAADEIQRVIAVNKDKERVLIEQMHARVQQYEQDYAAKKAAVIKKLDAEEQLAVNRIQQELEQQQQKLAADIKVNVEKIGQMAKQKKVEILAEAQAKQDQLGTATQQASSTTVQQTSAADLQKYHLFDNSQKSLQNEQVKQEHVHTSETRNV